MNFTVANHGKAKDASNYIHYPDVTFDDIPDMVTSGLNYCACRLKDEYRLDNNFDGAVDVLIIDVDESCTIDMAQKIFSKYTYYLITSKSHQKLKNDVVCDRFRLFIPLDKTIHIREKMEEVYGRFIDKCDFIDTSCRNVSRFFYASPNDAIIIHNKGIKYSTNTPHIEQDIPIPKPQTPKPLPNQEFTYKTWMGKQIKILKEVDENITYDGELDEEAKLKGVQSFLDSEYITGQRAVTLFKTSSMMVKDGFDEDFIVDYLLTEFNKRGGDKMNIAIQNIKNAFKY